MAPGIVTPEIAQTQIGEIAARIDDHTTALGKSLEQIDLMQQGRVLDDQGIRLHYGLAQPYFLVIDAAEGHDRGSHALGPKTRKSLRMPALEKGRDRKHLGRTDDALAAPAVYTCLEHEIPRTMLRASQFTRII